MKVRAYAAFEPKGRLEKYEYELAPLKPEDVRVKVERCGICHSDIHLIDNDWAMTEYPFVPGHEVVGIVEEAGGAVSHLKPGDRVGIGWQRSSCGCCEYCLTGDENLCPENQATCVKHHGGFGEYVQVSSRFAFLIPEGIYSDSAAPLLCGGITVFTPLRHYGAKPGMKVGVVGIGGLGHLALQFAGKFGCEVTAFSSSPSKEDEARKLGAHHFVNSKEAAGTDSQLDFIMSTASADLNWSDYIKLLKPNGKLCLLGAAPSDVAAAPMDLIVGRRSICGSCIGGRKDIVDMLNFASLHNISALTETVPLGSVNEALETVRENKARYRMVLAFS